MNAKYYGLLAYDAHIQFIEHFGLNEDYKNTHNCTTVVVESHIYYEQELCENDHVQVSSWLVSADDKRMHSFHEIYCLNKDVRVAVSEQMDIHVNLENRKASPFPSFIYDQLHSALAEYTKLAPPKRVMSRIKTNYNL